jgi:hypothetical protein
MVQIIFTELFDINMSATHGNNRVLFKRVGIGGEDVCHHTIT